MNDTELIADCMESCKDNITLKQMAFMLGRQRNAYEREGDDADELNSIISQEKLSEQY